MYSHYDRSLSCLADLILIAFLECLQPREASVSLVQLHTRNFSPHPQLTRDCICFLIKQGRVGVTFVGKRRRAKARLRGLEITIKISSGEVPKVIVHLIQSLKCTFFDSENGETLKFLDDQLKIYECIEYCRYYLDREGLNLKDDFKQLHKLQLMILELAQEQVFMVSWRALKTASESAIKNNKKSVSLNELIDLAYKYFISYRKRDLQIDFYRAPQSISNSSLRSTLLGFKLHEE